MKREARTRTVSGDVWMLLFTFALVLFAARGAAAHGREAATNGILIHPSDPNRILVRATFGLLYSTDGGATFRYRCPEAVGFDASSEDPSLAWLQSGVLLSGSFTGLHFANSDALCEFSPSNTFPRRYAIDVRRSTQTGRVFALDAPGDEANALLRSDDAGQTWQRLFVAEPHLLFERLRVAESNENVMYISGAIPAGRAGPTRRVQFLKSTDGGQSFSVSDLILEADERNAHVMAVDPVRPEVVYLRMVRRAEDTVPERLLVTYDGGTTWTERLRALQISSVVLRGDDIWVGSAANGLFYGTFAPDSASPLLRIAPSIAVVRCLESRVVGDAHELWLCSRDGDAFAVGKSRDGGQTFQPVWRYAQATSTIGCACSSQVGARCAMSLYDYFTDLGRGTETFSTECDAGVRRDAGIGSPPPRSSSCRASALQRCRMDGVFGLLLGLGWLGTLRKRRTVLRKASATVRYFAKAAAPR